MADNVKPRVKVPKSASAGEVITLKTLISHPMESGQRKNKAGEVIPRSIINRFTCDFNGQNVIDVREDRAVDAVLNRNADIDLAVASLLARPAAPELG